MEAGLKSLRIVWGAMLVAVLVYSYLCSFAKVHSVPNPVFIRVIAVVAFFEIAALIVLRRILLQPSMAVLSARPDDPSALTKWRAGNIVSWAFSLSIALYGLVLRYTGFQCRQVLPFFAAGFCLILFLPPRRPVPVR